MDRELLVLWSALVFYVVGGSVAIVGTVMKKPFDRAVLPVLLAGFVLHTASLGMRWDRLGHGPFVSMFEILSSNIWGLMLGVLLVYWRIAIVRPMAAVVMPILFVVMGWLLMTHPGETQLPSTYHTVWLFIHIGFAKVFLGATLLAVGVAGIVLLRQTAYGRSRFERLPDDSRLDELSFRFMALGLIFESLMLIAGAIWAQDAWGRYWAWDPLETWSFITWVSVVLSLHARLTYRVTPRAAAWMVLGVFVLAFLTFLGVPFISQAPHKGAV